MRRTRSKLTADRKISIVKYIQVFKEGDKVHIDLVPSSPIQHPRFQGKTGTVIGRRGRNYIVQISDDSVKKQIFLRPEHLILQK